MSQAINTPVGPFPGFPTKMGVSQAWYIVEIHHSGRKPSNVLLSNTGQRPWGLIELGTGTEDRTGFFPVILDRTGFLYRCTALYLTVRHAGFSLGLQGNTGLCASASCQVLKLALKSDVSARVLACFTYLHLPF